MRILFTVAQLLEALNSRFFELVFEAYVWIKRKINTENIEKDWKRIILTHFLSVHSQYLPFIIIIMKVLKRTGKQFSVVMFPLVWMFLKLECEKFRFLFDSTELSDPDVFEKSRVYCTKIHNIMNFALLQKYQSLTSQIRHSYFGNDTIDEHALYEYIALFSDINFAHGVDKSAKFHASKSKGKTFYYR